eukprot:335222-Pyramimonas_sp.AAC.1
MTHRVVAHWPCCASQAAASRTASSGSGGREPGGGRRFLPAGEWAPGSTSARAPRGAATAPQSTAAPGLAAVARAAPL